MGGWVYTLIQIVQQVSVIYLSGKEQSKEDMIQEVRVRTERSYGPRYIREA